MDATMLISDMHRAFYTEYYARRGMRTLRPHTWQPVIEDLVQRLGVVSILDYGCGPGASLAAFLQSTPVANYDPAVPAYASRPAAADLVVCNHVLEHIEPDCLDAVLAHLWSCTRRVAYVVVSCEVSTKVLPDGSPWHSCVHPPPWWDAKFQALPGLKRYQNHVAAWREPHRAAGGLLYRQEGTRCG